MRIVIDYQAAQTKGSKNRGIGRYSRALVKHMIQISSGKNDFFLLLNNSFPESVQDIRNEYDGIIPSENIVTFELKNVLIHANYCPWASAANEILYHSIVDSLEPDTLLITSLFESPNDESISHIGKYPKAYSISVILYDIIPYIYPDIYLANTKDLLYYKSKIEQMKLADCLLSISDSAREEASEKLNLPLNKIINISTAVEENFGFVHENEPPLADVLEKFQLSPDYIMYTGGMDYRKNIERLLQSYAKLDEELQKKHKLAVVCSTGKDQRKHYLSLSRSYGIRESDIVFTGYVSDEEISVLYRNCYLFVFPSWHEGFGLPVLEAMKCGVAVIGSKSSSIAEIIRIPEAMFDPYNTDSIKMLLTKVLRDRKFHDRLMKNSSTQASRYSWKRTAERALSTIEERVITEKPRKKRKLAVFSPIPPQKSGIAKYTAELVTELRHYFQVELIVEDGIETVYDQTITQKVRPVSWFMQHRENYDQILYHFGNSTFHEYMIESMKCFPGIVTVHDFFVSGLINHLISTQMKQDALGSLEDFVYFNHGYCELAKLQECENKLTFLLNLPLSAAVYKFSQKLIFHTEATRSLAQKWCPGELTKNSSVIPLLRAPRTLISREKARLSLGIKNEATLIVSFGIISSKKAHLEIAKAWQKVDETQTTHLIFAGSEPDSDYRQCIEEALPEKCRSNFKITGWLSDEEYERLLSAADIAIQLRSIDSGETSGAVIDCLSSGIPTIINRIGSMNDIPDEVCLKIDAKLTAKKIERALYELIVDCSRRKTLAMECAEYALKKYSPAICAKKYAAVLDRSWKGGKGNRFVATDRIGRIPERMSDSTFIEDIAQSVDRNLAKPIHCPQCFLILPTALTSKIYKSNELAKSLKKLLATKFEGFRIEPVFYCPKEQEFRYHRQLCFFLLQIPRNGIKDDVIETEATDIWFANNLQHQESIQIALGNHSKKVNFITIEDVLERFNPCDTIIKVLEDISLFDSIKLLKAAKKFNNV